MSRLHIVQGGIENGDKDWLVKAAHRKLRAPSWIAPKSAQPGDHVVIYVGGYGFFATGAIDSASKPRRDWPNRYGAGLGRISLIKPPISLEVIRRRIPPLTWANYPRSITTPSPAIADRIKAIIDRRRREKLPELKTASLMEYSIHELHAIAQAALRAKLPARLRKALSRIGSRAVHQYVLARAEGSCEGCGVEAPFQKADGSPYLEPHHVKRRADDGPDDPANVIALCPNCHRRAHHAMDADRFNMRLKKQLCINESNRG